MKKSVADYPLGLLISVLIISLIVYYGSLELANFLKMRSYQEFGSSVLKIVESMDYLKDSNAKYSFLNIKLAVPENQSIYFDNSSDSIILEGYFNRTIKLGHDIVSSSFVCTADCSIILCYYSCNTNHTEVVVFE